MTTRTLPAVLAVLLASCGGCGPDAPVAPPPRPAQPFRFRLVGPAPWNATVHCATGDAIGGDAAWEPAILDPQGGFVVRGREGEAYAVRAEAAPTAAERRMLWGFTASGTLGTGVLADPPGAVVVEAPPRATIELTAPAGHAGPDVITVYQEGTRTAASAIRDEQHGLDIAVWTVGDHEDGNSYRMRAPPRPWRLDELAPGRCVLAARTDGRQWTALRVDLSAGAFVTIDAGAQPPADEAGAVVCEDPFALLLLGGELAVPAPRRTTRLQFRSRWEGVPAGAHRLRYADGREVEITVEPGAEVRLGR